MAAEPPRPVIRKRVTHYRVLQTFALKCVSVRLINVWHPVSKS